MLQIVTLLVLAAASDPTAPAAPAIALPDLAHELLAAEPPPADMPAGPQGMEDGRRPRGFVAIGGHYVEGEVDSPLGEDPDSGTAFSIDLGLYTWNESLGLAIEGGYMASSYEIEVSSLADDDVDVKRYLLGLRFVDDEADSFFLYHLRGGFLFREDEGELLEDDGSGWYLGGGIEWKFGRGFSLGPQLLYTDSGSLDATEWIAGVAAAFAF
jgi:hypothetical protein